MSKRLLRTPLVLVVLLSGAATAFGMPYMPRTAAPGLTISTHPAADTNLTSANFGLAKSGTITLTQCKLDAAAYATCGTTRS